MLISRSALLLFVTGAALLLVIPGPAVTYVVSRSIGPRPSRGPCLRHGHRRRNTLACHRSHAGTFCSPGLIRAGIPIHKISGCRVPDFISVFALSVATVHNFCKPPAAECRLLRIFVQGVLVNLLNPKTALFFSCLPAPVCGPIPGPSQPANFPIGESCFAFMGWISDSLWAVSRWHRGRALPLERPPPSRCSANVSGGALIALGLASAFLRRQNEMISLSVPGFAVSFLSCQLPLQNNSTSSAPAVKIVAKSSLRAMARAGCAGAISTSELAETGARILAAHGAHSSPPLVYNFPGDACISVNDEVVHGIPGRSHHSGPATLVKLDLTAEKGRLSHRLRPSP